MRYKPTTDGVAAQAPIDPDRCRAAVWNIFANHQCTRKATVVDAESGEKEWCRQHDPDSIRARDAERMLEISIKEAHDAEHWAKARLGGVVFAAWRRGRSLDSDVILAHCREVQAAVDKIKKLKGSRS